MDLIFFIRQSTLKDIKLHYKWKNESLHGFVGGHLFAILEALPAKITFLRRC